MTKKAVTTEEGVKTWLTEKIADMLSVDESEITPGASIKEDLGGDSLDAVEIVMEIEEHYEISISDEEAEAAPTFGKIVDLVTSKLK